MSWCEVSPGRYQRPIGENESFIKLVGDSGHALGREHWAINVVFTVSGLGVLVHEDLPSLFLLAWKTLRFDHPGIAVYIVDDRTLGYDVPDSGALDEWASETFHVVPDKTAEEVIAGIRPSSYATLTYLPKTKELLCHTAHWRADGIELLYVCDAFLNLVVKQSLSKPPNLPWGEEPARLAPPVEEAASMPIHPSPADTALAAKCVKTFGAASGAVGIKYRGSPDIVPAGTRSACLHLSEAETKTVVQACKLRNLSVTSAVHAAVAGANYAMSASVDRHYTSTVRSNLRPYLPAPYSRPEYACGLYTTGWMKAVPANATWSERARAFQEEYGKGLNNGYISAHREYALRLGALIRNMPQGGEPPSDVDISSIGLGERFVNREKGTAEKGIRVDGMSIGAEILTRQSVCFVWTFMNQLCLNVVYNESFHEGDQMQEVVKTIKDILLRELEI